MTARCAFSSYSNPKRKPATQSRPMAAVGGMDSRQVGSPAGGRRTAAMFSSFGVAACNSILARDRHRDNGEVRRLGFAPIPGRRSNSNPWGTRGERAAWLAAQAVVIPPAGACSTVKMASCDWTGNRGAGVAPGRARIISTTRRDTCRGCGGRKEWCDCRERTACERARGSTDPRRPSVESGRARNSFRLSMRGARAGRTPMRAGRGGNAPLMEGRNRAGRRTPDLDIRPALPLASGDALCMARVGHGGIDAACKNIDGR